MADSDDFVAVARVIERASKLNEMQSRGLVRLLLKQAGLNANDVTATQLVAVGNTLLHEALVKNGVADPQGVIRQWLVLRAPSRGAPHQRAHAREQHRRGGVRAHCGVVERRRPRSSPERPSEIGLNSEVARSRKGPPRRRNDSPKLD